MKLNRKDYLFVVIQFGLFFLYLFKITIIPVNLPHLIKILALILSIFGGLLILLSLLQLNKNLSPFPTPKANAKLIQVGLYKYVRHPIYTGILIMLFSYGFYAESLFKTLITFVLYVLFSYKSSYEEKRLTSRYPNYQNYKNRTGRFLPKWEKE